LVYDRTTNNGDCLFQVLNPNSGGGHTVDNYILRTQTVAGLFAKRIDESVPCTVGVEQLGQKNTWIHIFPNPVNEILHLSTESNIQKCAIFTLEGKKVLFYNSTEINPLKQIDLAGLSPGVYLLNIWSDDQMFIQKIIVSSR
jgi:hypothetical protein